MEPAVPRRAALWATLTYALATLMLAWPALLGGFLVNPRSDQYSGGFPVRDFAGQALKAGQGIPEWNPYLFGGMPYIAAMHGDIFYPTALLRLLLPTDVGMSWGMILHVFLAGCFTYGFLRAWGLGFFPSLVGGVAFMLSGNVAALVSPGHDGKMFVSALMPLALWFLVRGVRDGRLWAWGGLAIAVGLGVLSPHPQLLQYMLLTCGAMGLFLAFGARADGTRLERGVALRRLAFAAGAVAIGFAMGAVQYLPVMDYIEYSPRSGGKGYEYATSYSMPIEELFNTYLPQFSGILDNYWGRNGIHYHSEYLGAAVLLLASAAFGGESRKSFRRLWTGILIISVLWALGGSTPFYHLIYAIVPGSKFFRAPSTMLMVVAMATSVLAALGTERVLSGAVGRRLAMGWLIGAGVIALLATLGVLTSIGESMASGYFGGQLVDAATANRGAVTVGAWRSFLFVALAAGLVFALSQRQVSVRASGWALAAIVALDLWSVDRQYWIFSAPASALYAPDAATEYLKTAPVGRVVATPLSNDGLVQRDPNFSGDGLMVHRVRLATGYHGNELGRYRKMVSTDGSERYDNVLNPAFWRLANVRYLYTNADVSQSPEFVRALGAPQKLVGPVRSAAGSTVYLFRLAGDNPPAWVVPVLVKASPEAALGTILDPRFDPLRAATVDTSATVGVSSVAALPEPVAVTPTVTRYDAGHIALQLTGTAPAGSALIVSENWYPGWSATVDGRRVETVRANHNLIAVPLPTGARSVQLDFADPAYQTGKLVTLAATLAALALVAAGVLAERRQRAA